MPAELLNAFASVGTFIVVAVTAVAAQIQLAHLRRSIPAHVRTALIARDPVCVVPGCHTRDGLEIDHIVAFADGGVTGLSNLCRMCRWHHSLKTHQGYLLTGGPGDWGWEPPETHAHGPPDDIADITDTRVEQR